MYIVYGKRSQESTSKVLSLLVSNYAPYQYREIGVDLTEAELVEVLGKKDKSAPQVVSMTGGFGEYIGGYEELANILK